MRPEKTAQPLPLQGNCLGFASLAVAAAVAQIETEKRKLRSGDRLKSGCS